MIRKIEYITGKDGNGNVYGAIPSDTEIIARVNEVIDCINSLSEEKPSEDLEEAAKEYAILDEEGKWKDGGKYKGFIAGAGWQKQRDAELIEIAYNDGITIGKTKQKEQMLKDAVEGRAHPEECEIWVNLFGYGYKYNAGDKVKMIILKDGE